MLKELNLGAVPLTFSFVHPDHEELFADEMDECLRSHDRKEFEIPLVAVERDNNGPARDSALGLQSKRLPFDL